MRARQLPMASLVVAGVDRTLQIPADGGGLMLAAGAASLAIADGSALLFVGLPGFASWLVWLLATGVRLVRARTADRPDDASTSDEET